MYLLQRQTLMTGLKVFSLTIALTLMSGCAVNMMSQQDEETTGRIGMLAETTNDLLFHLEDLDAEAPDCEYEQHAEQYREIKVQLKSFQMYEMTKPKNKHTLEQVNALQKRVNQLANMHKEQCLSAPVVRVTQNQINDMLGHMLKLETSKRKIERTF